MHIKWCIIQLSWIWVEFDEKWFRSFKSSDFYFLFDFKFDNLSVKWFWNFLDVFMCISCHKNCFWVGFLQNFQNWKFFTGSIDRNRLSTNWKYPVFKPKLYAWFDQCSIPLDRSKFISNFKGFWQISFCPISQFLFNSSWSLLEPFFFFCLFSSQSFKVFFYIIVKTLLPFLFYQITT